MCRAGQVDVTRSGKSRPVLVHLYGFVAKEKKKEALFASVAKMSDSSKQQWENKTRFSMNCEFLVLTRKNKGKLFIVESQFWFSRASLFKLEQTFSNLSKRSQCSDVEMLIDWVRSGRTGKYSAWGHGVWTLRLRLLHWESDVKNLRTQGVTWNLPHTILWEISFCMTVDKAINQPWNFLTFFLT